MLARPLGEFFGALLQQNLPRTRGRLGIAIVLRRRDGLERFLYLKAFRLRIAVHHHVADVIEQTIRPIAPALEGKQFRRVINQRRRRLPTPERFVFDHIFQKRNVRLHAANAKLLQRALHPIQRERKIHPARGDFHQQRIIKRRDHTAGVALPAIEPQPETGRRAIGDDAPVIGREIVGGILGGHAALHGVPDAHHIFLLGQLHHLAVQRVPLRHLNLRAHEVDARHHFRHRMLHLNARIHLDEIPRLGIHIVQKLHRARVVIPDMLGQFQRRRAQLVPHRFIQRNARSNLHHLLITPLHRAIALVQMQNIAVLIAQNLHFNVLGVLHVLLEEHRRVAERAARLASRFIEQPLQILGFMHHPHPTPATTEGSFDDQRKPNLLRDLHRLGAGFNCVIRTRKHRHASGLGQRARLGFVAHLPQQLRARPHKCQPRLNARLGEIGVLGQKSVARMHEINPVLDSHSHDTLDIEIRAHRPLAHAHHIRLISLKPMHRQPVFLRINSHRTQIHLRGRAKDANSNLAAIGRQ